MLAHERKQQVASIADPAVSEKLQGLLCTWDTEIGMSGEGLWCCDAESATVWGGLPSRTPLHLLRQSLLGARRCSGCETLQGGLPCRARGRLTLGDDKVGELWRLMLESHQ